MGPATSGVMLAEVVFQYRTLIGKCELGIGLDWDEIEIVSAIESAFAPSDHDIRAASGRRFRRHRTKLSAILRGDRLHDRVEITEMGPGGLMIRNAPYVGRGTDVEITVTEGDQTYRFRAIAVWQDEDGDDYRVGLQLQGMPVRLHTVALRHHEADVVDRISDAA